MLRCGECPSENLEPDLQERSFDRCRTEVFHPRPQAGKIDEAFAHAFENQRCARFMSGLTAPYLNELVKLTLGKFGLMFEGTSNSFLPH